MSATIAREVRRHRQARGMSAQQLADKCAEVGMPLQRTVISNIENGRRGNVSVAEVLVLAAALEVPPAALIFPAGYAEAVEYLPGRAAAPLEAADWWHGEGAAEDSALALARRHRELVRRIRGLYRGMWEQRIAGGSGGVGGPEEEAAREWVRELRGQLKELREEMAERGLVVPPVPGLEQSE